jgi:hypothetical protein
MKNISVAYALVDWRNVQRFLDPDFERDPRRKLPDLLLRIQQALAGLLAHRHAADSYRCTIRIYNGWHIEHEPNPTRRLFETFSIDQSLARRIGRVAFRPGFQFGNELACGTAYNPLHGTHNVNTGQKMVDTAISCDLLHLLAFGGADVAVIVSDDDDFVPALFTAHAWHRDAVMLKEPGSTFSHITPRDCSSLIHYWRTP